MLAQCPLLPSWKTPNLLLLLSISQPPNNSGEIHLNRSRPVWLIWVEWVALTWLSVVYRKTPQLIKLSGMKNSNPVSKSETVWVQHRFAIARKIGYSFYWTHTHINITQSPTIASGVDCVSLWCSYSIAYYLFIWYIKSKFINSKLDIIW